MKSARAKSFHFTLQAVVCIAILVALISAFFLLYPYDNFSYGTPGEINAIERTSEGIPIIRVGEKIQWNQPFCNKGANPTESQRWADVYGNGRNAGFVDIPEATKADRVSSFQVPTIIFYSKQNTCSTAPVFVILPNYIPSGAYYRFRIDTSYKPNPIRTITSTATTELFLLLDRGEPAP